MYHLATVFPIVNRFRLPVSRDQLMLLLVAVNLLFLGLDTYLSHIANGTLRPNELIPISFGVVGGGLLLLVGLISFKNRPLASTLATLILLASMAVGLLGIYFHLLHGILPSAPLGQRVTVNLLVWAPPVFGPAIFVLVGVFGISATWVEDPADSGILTIYKNLHIQLPYSKTRAYFYTVSMASLATVVSSVLDHARLNFADPWVWIPTLIGIFGTVVAAMLGMIRVPSRIDLITYIVAMVLFMVVGLLGAVIHINSNLVGENTVVVERFLRGAPFLAPMLFANVGFFGLLILLSPVEVQPST